MLELGGTIPAEAASNLLAGIGHGLLQYNARTAFVALRFAIKLLPAAAQFSGRAVREALPVFTVLHLYQRDFDGPVPAAARNGSHLCDQLKSAVSNVIAQLQRVRDVDAMDEGMQGLSANLANTRAYAAELQACAMLAAAMPAAVLPESANVAVLHRALDVWEWVARVDAHDGAMFDLFTPCVRGVGMATTTQAKHEVAQFITRKVIPWGLQRAAAALHLAHTGRATVPHSSNEQLPVWQAHRGKSQHIAHFLAAVWNIAAPDVALQDLAGEPGHDLAAMLQDMAAAADSVQGVTAPALAAAAASDSVGYTVRILRAAAASLHPGILNPSEVLLAKFGKHLAAAFARRVGKEAKARASAAPRGAYSEAHMLSPAQVWQLSQGLLALAQRCLAVKNDDVQQAGRQALASLASVVPAGTCGVVLQCLHAAFGEDATHLTGKQITALLALGDVAELVCWPRPWLASAIPNLIGVLQPAVNSTHPALAAAALRALVALLGALPPQLAQAETPDAARAALPAQHPDPAVRSASTNGMALAWDEAALYGYAVQQVAAGSPTAIAPVLPLATASWADVAAASTANAELVLELYTAAAVGISALRAAVPLLVTAALDLVATHTDSSGVAKTSSSKEASAHAFAVSASPGIGKGMGLLAVLDGVERAAGSKPAAGAVAVARAGVLAGADAEQLSAAVLEWGRQHPGEVPSTTFGAVCNAITGFGDSAEQAAALLRALWDAALEARSKPLTRRHTGWWLGSLATAMTRAGPACATETGQHLLQAVLDAAISGWRNGKPDMVKPCTTIVRRAAPALVMHYPSRAQASLWWSAADQAGDSEDTLAWQSPRGAGVAWVLSAMHALLLPAASTVRVLLPDADDASCPAALRSVPEDSPVLAAARQAMAEKPDDSSSEDDSDGEDDPDKPAPWKLHDVLACVLHTVDELGKGMGMLMPEHDSAAGDDAVVYTAMEQTLATAGSELSVTGVRAGVRTAVSYLAMALAASGERCAFQKLGAKREGILKAAMNAWLATCARRGARRSNATTAWQHALRAVEAMSPAAYSAQCDGVLPTSGSQPVMLHGLARLVLADCGWRRRSGFGLSDVPCSRVRGHRITLGFDEEDLAGQDELADEQAVVQESGCAVTPSSEVSASDAEPSATELAELIMALLTRSERDTERALIKYFQAKCSVPADVAVACAAAVRICFVPDEHMHETATPLLVAFSAVFPVLKAQLGALGLGLLEAARMAVVSTSVPGSPSVLAAQGSDTEMWVAVRGAVLIASTMSLSRANWDSAARVTLAKSALTMARLLEAIPRQYRGRAFMLLSALAGSINVRVQAPLPPGLPLNAVPAGEAQLAVLGTQEAVELLQSYVLAAGERGIGWQGQLLALRFAALLGLPHASALYAVGRHDIAGGKYQVGSATAQPVHAAEVELVRALGAAALQLDALPAGVAQQWLGSSLNLLTAHGLSLHTSTAELEDATQPLLENAASLLSSCLAAAKVRTSGGVDGQQAGDAARQELWSLGVQVLLEHPFQPCDEVPQPSASSFKFTAVLWASLARLHGAAVLAAVDAKLREMLQEATAAGGVEARTICTVASAVIAGLLLGLAQHQSAREDSHCLDEPSSAALQAEDWPTLSRHLASLPCWAGSSQAAALLVDAIQSTPLDCAGYWQMATQYVAANVPAPLLLPLLSGIFGNVGHAVRHSGSSAHGRWLQALAFFFSGASSQVPFSAPAGPTRPHATLQLCTPAPASLAGWAPAAPGMPSHADLLVLAATAADVLVQEGLRSSAHEIRLQSITAGIEAASAVWWPAHLAWAIPSGVPAGVQLSHAIMANMVAEATAACELVQDKAAGAMSAAALSELITSLARRLHGLAPVNLGQLLPTLLQQVPTWLVAVQSERVDELLQQVNGIVQHQWASTAGSVRVLTLADLAPLLDSTDKRVRRSGVHLLRAFAASTWWTAGQAQRQAMLDAIVSKLGDRDIEPSVAARLALAEVGQQLSVPDRCALCARFEPHANATLPASAQGKARAMLRRRAGVHGAAGLVDSSAGEASAATRAALQLLANRVSDAPPVGPTARDCVTAWKALVRRDWSSLRAAFTAAQAEAVAGVTAGSSMFT